MKNIFSIALDILYYLKLTGMFIEDATFAPKLYLFISFRV